MVAKDGREGIEDSVSGEGNSSLRRGKGLGTDYLWRLHTVNALNATELHTLKWFQW